jgi:rSAM/selenodomain-associated transferase 2
MPASLSVIIPTLNASVALPETAEALLSGATDGLIRELVISDGGSTDQTREAAAELGALWLPGPPGRGMQIARGVAASSAPWLLILHADTHLSDGWTTAVRHHIADRSGMAGYFRLKFRANGIVPRFVAGGTNLRSRWLSLPYGDQGLLISRRLLEDVGGYPEIPLMEDVAMARRLKGRLRPLDAEARTSAERYLRDGWARRIVRNLGTLLRYKLGANPDDLVARYER